MKDLKRQIHIGKLGKDENDTLWHSDSEGNYWCGNWYHRTPKQLKIEAESVLEDLKFLYPKLFKK